MNKIKRKYRKIFSRYSCAELKNILNVEIDNYQKIIKSSAIAQNILSGYGLTFFDTYKDYKDMIEQLILLCKEKNVEFNICSDEISCYDIIDRINESRYAEIARLEEMKCIHDYVFNTEDLYLKSMPFYTQINDLYDSIIDNLKIKDNKIKVKR